ncbi:uncharacterized protein NECHADRAFT_97336 [Fusarium vanettenii 77-13-4]|uniref:Aminoglycoside phosphotransferase domain-containing protein n=1 Tax=Fusarium vanettenii (strain ATCC MYA-4622 / CBS 123669 / FGSC 9596 / NRRL 45880 / 77-13-4) TaxID=660122 RepID=C7ZFX1_FUSV7|nr:uncharacterized protein NECHADRAFT_97336 [Fusarium vanettenii 77-13-4]EEU37132.1 hypothetical protein NECHADRAFT_97336 [Fusarium vanettenii 77-13-4]
MAKPTREGLAWEDRLFEQTPVWKTKPDVHAIETVCRRHFKLQPEEPCIIKFSSAGTCHRSYHISGPSLPGRFLMRIRLPVDPSLKTMGEVATLEWVRHFTKIPVPDIIAFDASSDNEIGFEWLMMPVVDGSTAYSMWRKMPMAAKERLSKQVANFQAQLFIASNTKPPLRGIGTLTCPPGGFTGLESVTIGQLVDRFWSMGSNYDYNVPRGPFASSREYADSYIRIIIEGIKSEFLSCQDEDDIAELEAEFKIAERLLGLLPTLFPVAELPEPTVVCHEYLILKNISVDDKGAIVAISDWEYVSAIPYWRATEMPDFLEGPEREIMPIRDGYSPEDPEVENEGCMGDDNEPLDNEGVNSLYWIHQMEYEKTQLRKIYNERMRELQPTWDTEVAAGTLKNDFMAAVGQCFASYMLDQVGEWIDAIEKGDNVRLRDFLEPKDVL